MHRKYNYVSSHEKWVESTDSIELFWEDSIFKPAVYYGLIKGNGYNVLPVWFLENKNKLEALNSNISLRI